MQKDGVEGEELKRALGLFSAIMLVSGVMIGSGIFIVSADIARQMSSPQLLLGIWVFTGVVTLLGAKCYGRLASAFPHTGGQYIYLKEAWGNCAGFLYGWALFFVIQTGTIAAVAVAFAKFLGVFWPFIASQQILVHTPFGFSLSTQQAVAIIILVTLTAYNCKGVKEGAVLQNIFTVLKVGALLAIVGLGFLAPLLGWAPSQTLFFEPKEPPSLPLLSAFAVATVGALFSADAWNNVTFIASEIKAPEKNLPKALLYGTFIVLTLYVLANLAYVTLLPFEQIQHAPEDRVATAVLSHIWSSQGAYWMAGIILVSTFGCLNGMILAGARVFFAMAKDKLFFPAFQTLHDKNQTPVVSLAGQCTWACLLTLSGSYGQLLDYIIFTTLIFYVVTVLGLFKLAKHHPEKIPMSPLDYGLGWLYIALLLYVALHLAVYKQHYTLPGLGIVCLGIPIYLVWQKLAPMSPRQQESQAR